MTNLPLSADDVSSQVIGNHEHPAQGELRLSHRPNVFSKKWPRWVASAVSRVWDSEKRKRLTHYAIAAEWAHRIATEAERLVDESDGDAFFHLAVDIANSAKAYVEFINAQDDADFSPELWNLAPPASGFESELLTFASRIGGRAYFVQLEHEIRQELANVGIDSYTPSAISVIRNSMDDVVAIYDHPNYSAIGSLIYPE